MLKRLTIVLLIILLLLVGTVMVTPVSFVKDQLVATPMPWISSIDGTINDGNVQIDLAKMDHTQVQPILPYISTINVGWEWCPANGLTTWCVTAESHKESKSQKSDANMDAMVSVLLSTMELLDVKLDANVSKLSLPQLEQALPAGLVDILQMMAALPSEPMISGRLRVLLATAQLAYADMLPQNVDGTVSLDKLNVAELASGDFKASIKSAETDKAFALQVNVKGGGKLLRRVAGAYDYELDAAGMVLPDALKLSGGTLKKNINRLALPDGFIPTWLAGILRAIGMLSANPAISGQMALTLDKAYLAYSNMFPKDTSGTLAVNKLNVAGQSLGDYSVVIQSDEQSALGMRITGGGELLQKVAGNFTLTEKSYRYNMALNSNNLLVKGYLLTQGKPSSTGGFLLTGSERW